MRQINESDHTLTWYMITAARILFAKYWKTSKIPKISEWLEKLVFCAEMDKITKKNERSKRYTVSRRMVKIKKLHKNGREKG